MGGREPVHGLRPMSSIPLQRSLEKAEKEGWLVDIAERYIPFPKPHGHHKDWKNLFDALGVKGPPLEVIGIQACRDGDVAEHLQKYKQGYTNDKGRFVPPPTESLERFKAAGGRAVIWGWGERVKRDESGNQVRLKDGTPDSRKVWTCREVVL